MEQPLVIDVNVEDGEWLVVTNTVRRRESVESGTQLGLKHTVSRYRFLDYTTLDIGEREGQFIVSSTPARFRLN